jgi:SAM-dependent methyltransferase
VPETSLKLRVTEGHEVPLGYVREGNEVHLIAREKTALWPVPILRAGRALLIVEGEQVTGATELVTEEAQKTRILSLFLSKYGGPRFQEWYGSPYRVLTVHLGQKTPDPSEGNSRYYEWLRSEFDNVAYVYDHHIFGNKINTLLRDRSLELLRKVFAPAHHIVEIGCGSGAETLSLLEEGKEVVAVDISPKMLEVISQKAKERGLSERLRTVNLPARDLSHLISTFGPGSFDAGYSTYGALNSEPGIRSLPPALHTLLRPSGPFVAGAYNRWCLFEMLGYGLRGKWGRVLGRIGSSVPVGSSRFCIDVFAYSAPYLGSLFRPYFRVERVEGVPFLLPPSDLVKYLDKFQRREMTLRRWDKALGKTWPFNYLGDHFLLTMRRVP